MIWGPRGPLFPETPNHREQIKTCVLKNHVGLLQCLLEGNRNIRFEARRCVGQWTVDRSGV